jgi:D-3-phosphoglycerate dehydrogenase / 2-oxoglutarate reductase
MSHVLITTVPFGAKNREPLDLLKQAGATYVINPLNKKLTEDELCTLVADAEIIIAGTEPITEKVMSSAPNLKLISRVGIGLDNVDLLAAEKKNILVSYTPDAPAPAVAELTIGLMLSTLRATHVSNARMHAGNWHRHFGRRLSENTIGIIGAGRIGSKVLKHLQGFGNPKILLNDLNPITQISDSFEVEWVEKEEIYREADIISLHVPLTGLTKSMMSKVELLKMKQDAILINTARGGIVNESDLYEVLQEGHLSGVAVDVFEQEPYQGPLMEIERCLLTSHMGSMSVDCRAQMEIEATEEAVRFIANEPLKNTVPKEEIESQRESLSCQKQ